MIRFLALVVAMTAVGLTLAQQPPGKQPPPPADKGTPPGDKTPPDKAPAPPPSDLDKFVGVWGVTALTRDGKSDDAKLKERNLKVKITKLDGGMAEARFQQADDKVFGRASFKIEAPASGTAPGRLAFTSSKGHDELGIYQFKGEDTLELCLAPPGQGEDRRPTAFKGEAGNTAWTLQREKDKPKPAEDKTEPKKTGP